MKRFFSSVMVGLLSISILAGCGGASGSGGGKEIQAIKDRGVLNVGVKVDVPKFGLKDPKTNTIDGLEIDIAKAVAKKILGDASKVNLVGVNAQTRGESLKNGELDIVAATFTIKEDRKLLWNFSQPYFKDFVGLLVKKDGPKSFKDLNGKKIGVAKSATTKDALSKAATEQGVKVEFLDFNNYPDIKAALDAGRVDAFSVDIAILLGYLDDKTVILEDRFAPQEYGVATKLENKELAKLVDDVVGEMLKNGEMDTLLKKWELK